MIPKTGGKLRRLGIPTVRDRVVQAALKLVLEPIFEADCAPRGAAGPDAVRGRVGLLAPATHGPVTRRLTSTSRRNRSRNRSSCASPGCTTLTATGSPSRATPRKTWPIPPAPSRRRRRYGPIRRGSRAPSGSNSTPPPNRAATSIIYTAIPTTPIPEGAVLSELPRRPGRQTTSESSTRAAVAEVTAE